MREQTAAKKLRVSMLLLAVFLILVGCKQMERFHLELKETMEGSEAWISELTQGMRFTVEHPEGAVSLGEPQDILITIFNEDGEYSPRLNDVLIETMHAEDIVHCTLINPPPADIAPFGSGVLFYLPPWEVSRGSIRHYHD